MSDLIQSIQGKLLFPFIAPPNGGKGTQTQILASRYGLPTFDMGATFRAIMKEGRDPALKATLEAIMKEGKLVPIEIVAQVFQSGFLQLVQAYPEAPGFILDGFPRNQPQAEVFETLCQTWGARVAQVIYLHVSDDLVKARATGRRFCSANARHVYNVLNPALTPKQDHICDLDGAELILRPDDQPETVEKRLVEYHQETDPLIAFFESKNLLLRVNGEQPPEKVTAEIEAKLSTILPAQVALEV